MEPGVDPIFQVYVIGATMPPSWTGTASRMVRTHPDRVPSAGTPDVTIVGVPEVVQKHPLYPGAKAGDVVDAVGLVRRFMSGGALDRFVEQVAGRHTILVGVTAVEAGSVNEIPSAMATFLAARTGLPVALDVVQINRAGHTKASGWIRLANQALFDGPVIAGAEYWLVDDFVGQGGTFANLRGHIESRGGRVIGMTALTGRDFSAKLALSSQILAELRAKHGGLEEWWRRELGFGFEALTESEGRYLLRAEDADTIRNRLAEAAQQGRAR